MQKYMKDVMIKDPSLSAGWVPSIVSSHQVRGEHELVYTSVCLFVKSVSLESLSLDLCVFFYVLSSFSSAASIAV